MLGNHRMAKAAVIGAPVVRTAAVVGAASGANRPVAAAAVVSNSRRPVAAAAVIRR
jgi:hypothetical protein